VPNQRLERVKGIEPSYSAWKTPDYRNVFNSRSDISQLFGRLRSLANLSQSEWRSTFAAAKSHRPLVMRLLFVTDPAGRLCGLGCDVAVNSLRVSRIV